jgi:glycopeptide antibiotics resistance protein
MIRSSLNWKALARMGALGTCIGAILFSSTSLAGNVLDGAFTRYVTRQVLPYDTYDLYHRYHVHFLAEKDLHLTMFVVLGFLLWRVFPEIRGKAAAVLILGALISCCSELLQSLFPGRDPALRDVLINAAGMALGTGLSWIRSRGDRNNRQQTAE